MPTSSSTTRIIAIFGFLLLHQGQADVHPRATLRCIADFNGALMLIDDLLDDGQAEPGTAGLGGDIGFEDARQQFERKTGAIVGDQQPCLLAGTLGHDADGRGIPSFERIFRIAQQIVNDLAQLCRIAQHLGQIAGELRLDRHCRTFVEPEYLADQRVEVERLDFRHRQTRIVAEIVDHPLHRLHLVDDRLRAARQHVGVAVHQLAGQLELETLGGQAGSASADS